MQLSLWICATLNKWEQIKFSAITQLKSQAQPARTPRCHSFLEKFEAFKNRCSKSSSVRAATFWRIPAALIAELHHVEHVRSENAFSHNPIVVADAKMSMMTNSVAAPRLIWKTWYYSHQLCDVLIRFQSNFPVKKCAHFWFFKNVTKRPVARNRNVTVKTVSYTVY